MIPIIANIGHILLPQHHMEVYLFPNDARLRSIQRLQNNKKRYSLLKSVLSNSSGNKAFRHADIHTLQYKPERRYVACLMTSEGKKSVLKAYRPRAYEQTLAHLKQLDALGIKRFSPLIGHHKKYHILIFQWREGTLLSEHWQTARFDVALLKKLAHQLVDFHQGTWQQIAETRKNNLSEILQGLAHLIPYFQEKAQFLGECLQVQLQQIPGKTVRCHGDFYAKQILCQKDKLYWLDLDDICLAHPGRDLATFVAHLEWDVVRGRLTAQQASHYEQVFVEAYQQYAEQSLEPHHLESLIALHLFQLIHHPFRNCESNWIQQTEMLLGRIELRLQKNNEAAYRKMTGVSSLHTTPTIIQNPFTLNGDAPLKSLLEQAINPEQSQRGFKRYLSDYDVLKIDSIRVLRYKPGKRLLVEYCLLTDRGRLTLLGKIRAKGLHRSIYRINQQLYDQRDTLMTEAGWQVPQPLCMIPECQMWLQQHVPGDQFTQLLNNNAEQGQTLAQRIAQMSHSLHNSGIVVEKSHSVVQELDILKKQLATVAEQCPQLKMGIRELCEHLSPYVSSLFIRPYRCIHRDFYPDQVIVDKDRLYLLDLDLFCMGDPCLDIGNFVAHIQEQALREKGDLLAYQSVTDTLIQHYLQLSKGHQDAAEAIEKYRLLSLARHIAISQRLTDRSHLSPVLLELSLDQMKS
ncbi:MAG: phosphotransferase [Gammaproteobacteria bacterium]|nr:phosphotransferase [Gammaproteobacteria bacterium]